MDSGVAEQAVPMSGGVATAEADPNAGNPVNYTPEGLTPSEITAQAAAAARLAAAEAQRKAWENLLKNSTAKEIIITLSAIAAQISSTAAGTGVYNTSGLKRDVTEFSDPKPPHYTVPYVGFFGSSGPNQTDISEVYKRIVERIMVGRSLFNVIIDTIGHVNWALGMNSFHGGLSRHSGLSKTTMMYLLFEAYFVIIQKISSVDLTRVPRFEDIQQDAYKIKIDVLTDLDTLTDIQQSVFSRQIGDDVIIGPYLDPTVKAFIGNMKQRLIEDDVFIDNAFNAVRTIFKNVHKSASAVVEKLALEQPRTILNKLGAFASVASLPQQLILSRIALGNLDASYGTISSILPAIQSAQQAQAVSPFLDDSYVDDSSASLLRRLLSEGRFSVASNGIKILSVGLPSGFMKHLSSKRVGTNEFNTGAPNLTPTSQKDVIVINVYKRDYEYDAIIFKPQNFFFEMTRTYSRYVMSDVGQLSQVQMSVDALSELPGNNHHVPGASVGVDRFGRVVPGSVASGGSNAPTNVINSNNESLISTFDATRMMTINYDSKLNSKLESLFDIRDDEAYDFLNDQEKESLFKNHVVSYLLSLYTRMLTGLSLNEDSFILGFDDALYDVDAKSKKFFDALLKAHIVGIIGGGQQSSYLNNLVDRLKNVSDSREINALLEKIATTIPDITSGAKIELSQDMLGFLSIFSPKSIFGGGTVHSSRILAPKLFERIFNIVVDENDFEIDLAKTTQSPNNSAGEMMYNAVKSFNNSNDGMTMIKEMKTDGVVTSSRLVKPTGDNMSLVEYFVTIETANNRVD